MTIYVHLEALISTTPQAEVGELDRYDFSATPQSTQTHKQPRTYIMALINFVAFYFCFILLLLLLLLLPLIFYGVFLSQDRVFS